MIEIPVENVDKEEEMAFDDLTIPGDYPLIVAALPHYTGIVFHIYH